MPEPGIEPDVRCKQNWAKDTGIASLIYIVLTKMSVGNKKIKSKPNSKDLA